METTGEILNRTKSELLVHKQALRAAENARISQCNPALLKHYKQDSEKKGVLLRDMTSKMKTIALSDKLLYVKTRAMDEKKRDYE